MSAIGLAFLLLCAAILILVALIFIAFLASEASIERLRPLSLSAANNHSRNADNVPSISVIFAARNEELSIEQATRSMLALDYPNMELIVVDDRSTDQTPSILLRLKQESPDALQTIRVELLPHEWLGKCHALHVGAQSARGEWLLFTDADIHMHPSTLQTTLDFASRKKADHLTLAPYCNMPSWILNTFVATFAFLFKAFVKPNQISNPKSSAHVGVGAFNLVRRSTYQAIGGHASVRLCPDDDVKLGKRIKLAGFQQRFANGMDLIRVPWYASLGEVFRGLEKNCFAGIDYSIPTWIGSNIFIFSSAILPWLLLPFATGTPLLLLAIACALWLCIGSINAIRCGYRIDHGLALPIGIFLFLLVLNRSVILTLIRRGIFWRDTFYSLDELRKFQNQSPPKPPT